MVLSYFGGKEKGFQTNRPMTVNNNLPGKPFIKAKPNKCCQGPLLPIVDSPFFVPLSKILALKFVDEKKERRTYMLALAKRTMWRLGHFMN
jgi:hypothetical protein